MSYRADRRFGSSAGSAVNGRAQLFDFFRQQVAVFARVNVQCEGAVADALELLHVVPGLLKHRADLAVAAFDQRDFIPGVVRFMDELDAGWGSTGVDAFAVGQLDAGAELFNGGVAGLATNLDKIRFWNMRGCLGEGISQLSVVGEQQETLTGVVQASYRVDALLDALQEVDNRGTPFRVAERSDVALGLVQQDVNMVAGELDELAVDADMVFAGVGLRSELSDGLAVDLDEAGGDEFLGFAAGGDTRGGDDLL